MVLSNPSVKFFPLVIFLLLLFSLFLKNGLNRWSKQIEDSVFLINGQVKDEDTELLEGQVSAKWGNWAQTNVWLEPLCDKALSETSPVQYLLIWLAVPGNQYTELLSAPFLQIASLLGQCECSNYVWSDWNVSITEHEWAVNVGDDILKTYVLYIHLSF